MRRVVAGGGEISKPISIVKPLDNDGRELAFLHLPVLSTHISETRQDLFEKS